MFVNDPYFYDGFRAFAEMLTGKQNVSVGSRFLNNLLFLEGLCYLQKVAEDPICRGSPMRHLVDTFV